MKNIIDLTSATTFLFSMIALVGTIERNGSADAIFILLTIVLASVATLAREEIYKRLK